MITTVYCRWLYQVSQKQLARLLWYPNLSNHVKLAEDSDSACSRETLLAPRNMPSHQLSCTIPSLMLPRCQTVVPPAFSCAPRHPHASPAVQVRVCLLAVQPFRGYTCCWGEPLTSQTGTVSRHPLSTPSVRPGPIPNTWALPAEWPFCYRSFVIC